MPDDVRYNNIGSFLISGSTSRESPIVKVIAWNGKTVQSLQDLRQTTRLGNQSTTGASDLDCPQDDITNTGTLDHPSLQSLPLKRSCSDDTVFSPPSLSITSVESDTIRTNELDDCTNSTRTSEEVQDMNHSSQEAMYKKDALPKQTTNEECHPIDASSDMEDASESESRRAMDDDSRWILSDSTLMKKPVPHNNSTSEHESSSSTAPSTTTYSLASAIKISLEETIPICLTGPWRGMKRPNVSHRIVQEFPHPHKHTVLLSPLVPQCMRRAPPTTVVSSDCCSCHVLHSTRKGQVRFATVHQRFFHQTIGDNPSVPIGTPITLDWTYEDDIEPIPIDEFEQSRLMSRKKGNNRLIMHRLALSYYQRRNILFYYAGCTEEQLNQAEREVARARRHRQITAFFSDLWRVEDLVTSLGRKSKRLFLFQQQQQSPQRRRMAS